MAEIWKKSSKLKDNILKLKILDFKPEKIDELNSSSTKQLEKNQDWIKLCTKIKDGFLIYGVVIFQRHWIN